MGHEEIKSLKFTWHPKIWVAPLGPRFLSPSSGCLCGQWRWRWQPHTKANPWKNTVRSIYPPRTDPNGSLHLSTIEKPWKGVYKEACCEAESYTDQHSIKETFRQQIMRSFVKRVTGAIIGFITGLCGNPHAKLHLCNLRHILYTLKKSNKPP